MIKDNQKTLNKLQIIIDACVIVISYFAAWFLRFRSPLIHVWFLDLKNSHFYTLQQYSSSLFYVVPAYLLIYYISRLYMPKRIKLTKTEVFSTLQGNTLGIAFFTFFLYFIDEKHYSRFFLILFYVVNCFLTITFRFILSYFLKAARKKGYNLKHILLVGYSRAAESYIDRIFANPQWGYYIHGILDDSLEKGTLYKKVPVIGAIIDLESSLSNKDFDEIAITLSVSEYARLEQIVGICEKSGVHTKFVPDYNNFIPTKPYTEDLNGLPVINIRYVPLSNTFNGIIKRIFDLVGAFVALIIFSVPMLIVMLIIRLTSKGPIVFSQIRVGKHRKEFKMYKFRSMVLQPDNKEKKKWTTINDPRITKIGKFIRKTSIDELPQLFNVLKGDMSLVGPRPERPFFVEKFKEEIPRYMIKHQVRPGLTGWAQINGYRGDTSIRKRIDHDLYYIENWTLGLDIKILFLTIFKGFINKNAY